MKIRPHRDKILSLMCPRAAAQVWHHIEWPQPVSPWTSRVAGLELLFSFCLVLSLQQIYQKEGAEVAVNHVTRHFCLQPCQPTCQQTNQQTNQHI